MERLVAELDRWGSRGFEEVSTVAKNYRIISADSHLQIAAERWTPRIPAKYRGEAPRTVRMPDGTDATVSGIDGKPNLFTSGRLVGLPYEDRSPVGGHYETSPGSGSPEQRLREQDMDGVDGEILFTHFGGASYYSGIKERAASKATIHAWNEFLAEEYCVVAPQRLIGMGMLPTTGVQDAIDEMEYCARAGLKGVYLAKFPDAGDMPRPEDDRFWAAALDLDMPLAGHVSFGLGRGPVTIPYARDLNEVAAGVDPFSKFSQYAFRGALNALQMLFTEVLDRFPRLRFYFAETQTGWIPHFLEILDDQYDRHIHWAQRLAGMKKLDRRPSEYIREHFWWGFMRNAVGVRARHEIGVTRMMWGTDFAHAESDWPESQRVIDEVFAGVPEDQRRLMLGGNAIEYFHLDPAPPAQSEVAAVAGADVP